MEGASLGGRRRHRARLEEFSFEAPKEGYQSSIDLDQESPRSPGWQDMDEGGWFYIKTAQGYGLLKLRQMRGKRTLHYQVLLNSKGGTNLEPAQPSPHGSRKVTSGRYSCEGLT